MSNKGVTADSDTPLRFIVAEIMAHHRILFKEIDCRVESGHLLIRGKTCSFHALQILLRIIRQWFSSRAGTTRYPIYIRVLVGPEQTIFEKHYSIQESNHDPIFTKSDNQCGVPQGN